MIHHFSPTKMAKIQKTDNSVDKDMDWLELSYIVGEKCKMLQPLWKIIWQFLIKLNLGSKITADCDYNHEVKRHLLLGRKTMTNLDSILKSRDITLPTKVHVVTAMVFPEVMYICERWTVKKVKHQRIDAFKLCAEEDSSLESPLDNKEIKSVNPEGNQPWIFIARTEAETLILWPCDVKSRLIGKGHDAWKDWGQEEKEATEDEMVGWHHQLNGLEFEQTQGDSDRQRSLVCCSSWGCKESDMT